MTFRVLLVDDERPARVVLARMLADDSRFTVVGEASDGPEALERIATLRPDLVFLDVQMPGLDGFEVLTATRLPPLIIFATAHQTHAVRAFDADAVDYVLKPFERARVAVALEKAAARLAQPAPEPRLVFKSSAGWTSVAQADVLRVSAADKHVVVRTSSGDHVVREPLQALVSRLSPERFVQVHRSELVNVEHVLRLEPWTHGDGILVLRDGSTVVLTRTYRATFLSLFRPESRDL